MENKQREKSAAEAYREERKQRMAKAAKKQTKKILRQQRPAE